MAKSKKVLSLRSQLEKLETVRWQDYEPSPVVGVDEVGRGCLAGPVYAAAVCLKSDEHTQFFTDSKLLSEKRRDELAPLILQAHWVGVGFATVEEIDELNILQASLLAMKRAVLEVEIKMKMKTGHLLVDGNIKVPGLRCLQTPLIKGDLRCVAISAASIVAKVTRDSLMKNMGAQFPHYGFENHKGYGSPAHKKVIAEIGPCLHHRKSFSGVKEFLPRPSL
jgi:ribonuclease HII